MKNFLTTLLALAAICISAQTTLPTSWSFTTTVYPNGWTSSGTTFYTGSGNTPPACKFDSDLDYVEIYFSGAPGALTYYITGNSFSGGTFDVQESVNGTTWTTLHSYTTNMPTAYTQMTDNPAAASHYVRFYYTDKQSGNVGLDDVNLAAAAAGPQQEINVTFNSNTILTGGSTWFSSPVSTLTQETFTVENGGTSNTLNISNVTITGPNSSDFVLNVYPATVPASSSGALVVDFTPSAAGTRIATMTISSDDADESAYVINLYGAGGNFASEPVAAPTNLSFSNVKSYRFQLNWAAASTPPDGYIVLRRDDAAVTDVPVDGAGYDIGDQVGMSKVAYIGSGLSCWANYIGASEDYFFAVFSWNGPVPYRNYFETAPLSGSVVASGSMQPASYYSGINPNAPTFVDDLTALTYPHTDNFYSNYGPRMISLYWARDTTGGDKAITCVYSGENYVYTEPFAWTTFSREHTYCHSWMPTYPSSNGPEYSDYFNLYPTDQNNANAIRSNYPLGIVVGTPTYVFMGCKFGNDINGNAVFEPRDDQKGDAARSMFYMATCYNTSSQDWGFPNPISGSIPYGQDQNVLKQWHYMDPPDAREIAKNDFVDSLQGNRNPFIDSVNYACYIDFYTMTKINGPVVPCSSTNIGMTENPNTVQLGLWPNPTTGVFTLYYQTQITENITIRVIDVAGRVVYEQTMTAGQGSNAYMLDMRGIEKGAYTLQVSGTVTTNAKFLLQ
jgi:endonuclease I